MPGWLDILKVALYIGVTGYGGPAVSALAKRVFVHDKGWLTEKEFMNGLSIAQILPGPVAINLMGYVGYTLMGWWGGILVPFIFAFPAIGVMLVLSWLYFKYGDLNFVSSIFAGLGALVVAILFHATVTFGRSAFKYEGRGAIKGLIISAIAFINIYLLHLDIIIIILIGGAIGGLFFYFKGRPDKRVGDQSINNKIPIKIDKKDILIILSIMAIFTVLFMVGDNGWPIFFTFFKIGAFAFGGGYAAIPLIQHVVVDGMQWIDLKSFRDGIALGQITPGPVFITATFIGYKVNGVAGALIATIGVFSPSIAGVILIKGLHSKVKDYMSVRAVIKGFFFTFLGLIASITMRFGIQSITDARTFVLFLVSVAYLLVWKKKELWLILGVIAISLILF